MIKFLLICPTSALEKIFNPQNMLYIPLKPGRYYCYTLNIMKFKSTCPVAAILNLIKLLSFLLAFFLLLLLLWRA